MISILIILEQLESVGFPLVRCPFLLLFGFHFSSCICNFEDTSTCGVICGKCWDGSSRLDCRFRSAKEYGVCGSIDLVFALDWSLVVSLTSFVINPYVTRLEWLFCFCVFESIVLCLFQLSSLRIYAPACGVLQNANPDYRSNYEIS